MATDMKGVYLRQLRHRLDLSQVALAKELGVHSNTIARYERDELRISEPVARLMRLICKEKLGPHDKSM